MAVDSSIALQAQLPKFDNPLTQFAQVSAIQQAQNQNQLAQYTLAKAQRDDDEAQAVRNLLTQSGGDLEKGKNALMSAGYYKPALELGKTQLEQQAKQAAIKKDLSATAETDGKVAIQRQEAIGNTLGAIAQIPNVTPQHVVNGIRHLVDIGSIQPEMGQKIVASIPQDQSQLQSWLLTGRNAVLKAADQMKYTTPTADAKLQSETSIKTTGMNNAASRANNADNISKDLTVAGVGPDGKVSDDVETMAQAIAAGKLPPLSGFALAKPRGQAIMGRAMEINPTYDAGDYAAKNAALKGFSTGKEGTALRSFNVASDHLDTLGQMADALNNGNTQILNKIGNAWAAQTGGTAPTNFNAVKEIVGKEVVKAIVAGGGGVAEREELSKLLESANSPQQLKGVIGHFKELMDAQRSGLMDQYQRTTGRTDGDTVFAPSKKPPQQQVAEAVANGTSAKLGAMRPVQVNNAADYAALPSGTVYTAPDGSQRTKR
jgi:hypothetical protein